MASQDSPDVTTPDEFRHYFEIVPALSPALKDEVFAIRHRVYCEDLRFEPLKPDRRESDSYDAQSLHLLIRSVQSGEFVGCTRIVRVRPQDSQSFMPFEQACIDALDRSIVDPQALPRHSVGEISRLSVIAKYRRRKGELQQPGLASDSVMSDSGGSGGNSRRRFPLARLYLGTVELARLHGIETLFVLTEPRLANHFSKVGADIRAIGEAVEHHGTRIPSMMNTRAIIDNLKPLFRPLYCTVAKEVAAGLSLHASNERLRLKQVLIDVSESTRTGSVNLTNGSAPRQPQEIRLKMLPTTPLKPKPQ